MKLSSDKRKLTGLMGAVAAVLLTFASTGHAQNLYNAATTTANPQTGAVHYMQIVNPAQGAGNYTLTAFQLGLNFNTGTDLNGYGVIVYFYTGVNTSATAADALAGATQITGISGTLQDPNASGNFTYTFTLNTAQALSTPDGSFGVEFFLTDSEFVNYTTDANGRFTASTPTVGSSPGYVWNDANLNGTFAGSEQTRFGQTNANVRFSMTGTFTPVPEPGTWAMMGVGAALLFVVARRRLA